MPEVADDHRWVSLAGKLHLKRDIWAPVLMWGKDPSAPVANLAWGIVVREKTAENKQQLAGCRGMLFTRKFLSPLDAFIKLIDVFTVLQESQRLLGKLPCFHFQHFQKLVMLYSLAKSFFFLFFFFPSRGSNRCHFGSQRFTNPNFHHFCRLLTLFTITTRMGIVERRLRQYQTRGASNCKNLCCKHLTKY